MRSKGCYERQPKLLLTNPFFRVALIGNAKAIVEFGGQSVIPFATRDSLPFYRFSLS